jgi:hypothetical protein
MASTVSGNLTQCEVAAASRVFRLQFQLMNLIIFCSEDIARRGSPNWVFIRIDALVWRLQLNYSVQQFGVRVEVIARPGDWQSIVHSRTYLRKRVRVEAGQVCQWYSLNFPDFYKVDIQQMPFDVLTTIACMASRHWTVCHIRIQSCLSATVTSSRCRASSPASIALT